MAFDFCRTDTEDKQMEQGWNAFWESGSVTDYLAYCKVDGKERAPQVGRQEVQREVKSYGTVRDTDRDGLDCHAGGRL